MIESLADQWMRAGSTLHEAPGYLDVYEGVARFVLDEALRNELQRLAPHSLVGADAVLVRAVRAETEVRLRWGVTEGKSYLAPNTSDADELAVSLNSAIASWAAGAIVRRRAEMRALEAEPTLQQLADWLCAFSEALALALAREDVVRVPTHIIGGMVDLRAGLGDGAKRSTTVALDALRGVRDPSGRTFSSVDLEHWRLTPPHGHQLALHIGFDNVTKTPKAGDVRSVLTGGFLRAYLATWALTDHIDNPHGLFEMDARRVLLDLYGLKPTREKSRPNVTRPPRSAETELQRHFESLQNTLLEGIGDVRVGSKPQSLVSYYSDARDRRRVYQHAQLAMIAVSKHFIQVPQEVLHLDTKDTALAVGIARVLRHHARDVLRGAGHYRVPLRELADAAREDVQQLVRDRGAGAYYRALADRLHRVVSDGHLGTIHLEGEGPSAIVTLTPSLTLATVYQSLAGDRPTPPLEAALAARMGRPLPTGRPRKHLR